METEQKTGFIAQLNNYLRMVKFSHSIFALPFAGIAFIQALPFSGLIIHGRPSTELYILATKIILAMVSLRSAAMGFNRIVDRNYDRENPRTAEREIPSGKISITSARIFVLASLGIYVFTAFWINNLAGLLSPIPMAVVLGYSYTKRFTMFAHYVLGLAIGLAPAATWIAMLESIDLLPLLWSAGLMFYIAGFDTLYACQDTEFDRRMGLHSIPSRLGITPALWFARISHVLALGFFIAAGAMSPTGSVFTITVGIVAILFAIEHFLVRPGKLNHIHIAFFHINASISSVLFAGLLLDYLIR